MVPSDWERTSFGLLAEFRNGLNFTKADQGEAIKIVGVADFKDHSSLSNLDNLGVISVSNTVKDNDLIKSGDVLYVRSNGNKDLIGRCLFFPEVTEKLSFSGFTIRGRVTSKAILPNYLALLSRSEIVKQQFSKNGGGTNISNLSQQILSDVVVPLPSIEEQRKIAKILSTWDKAISTTEKLIETSKQQKKALMQQLLTGKKRLVNPETGKAFEGEWEEVKFSSFGNCIRGVSYKPTQISESENESTVRLLRSTNIQAGKLNDIDLVILPSNLIKPAQIMLKNDLAICMANGSKKLVGKSAPFNKNKQAYTVGAFCAIFRPKTTSCHSLVKHVFKSVQYRHQLKVILAGSAINNLKGSDIESMVITLPVSIEEQQKIASVLTSADSEIEVLEAKLAHFKQEKKALMQQLLTGKRRVKVDEMEVA